ncbi:MAG: hypothetical protein JWL73_1958 [Actinomycetia bacterium]|nr:hypothetical protein [Actinomycetes bacterium]
MRWFRRISLAAVVGSGLYRVWKRHQAKTRTT